MSTQSASTNVVRSVRPRALVTAALAGSCLSTFAAAADLRFVPVPFTNQIASSEGLSGDGSVVVGWTRQGNDVAALRWSRVTGYTFLAPPPRDFSAYAQGVNFDGSVIVGDSESTGVVWASSSAFAPAAAGVADDVIDVSGDGAVRITRTQIFASGSWSSPSAPPSTLESPQFNAVSGNGAKVVGTGAFRVETGSGYGGPVFTNFDRMFTYERGTGSYTVVQPIADYEYITGVAISADGRVTVGACSDEEGTLATTAVRSVDGGSAVSIGSLAAGTSSTAADVSADGSVIVGTSNNEAFVWTAALGMRSIKTVLTSSGVDLTGWTLQGAKAVSDSGQIIMGFGKDPQGRTRSWVADLSAVCTSVPSSITTTITPVAQEGQADGAGGVFGPAAFAEQSIEGSGCVAFGAARTDGRSGLYFADNNATQPVITPVSVTGVLGTYFGIDEFVLRSPTSIAFRANDSTVIAAGDPRGVVSTRFAAGQAAPDTGGGVFASPTPFSAPLLNGSGVLAFQSRTSVCPAGFSCFAAFKASASQTSRVRYGVGVGVLVYNPRTISLTDSGTVMLYGSLQVDGQAIVSFGQQASLPTRLTVGATLSNSSLTVTSLSGDLATSGAHVVARVGLSDGSSGLVHISAAGERTLLATSGDPTDASPGSAPVGSVPVNFAVTPSGRVYFRGSVQTGAAPLLRVDLASPRAVTTLLRVGDVLPGLTCRTVSAIGPFVNSSGERVLLSVDLGFPGEPTSKDAVLIYDPVAGIVPVLATGDSVTLSPGVTGTVIAASVPTRFNTTGDDGRATAMTPNGVAAVNAVVDVAGTPRQTLLRIATSLPPAPAGCGFSDVAGPGQAIGFDVQLTADDIIVYLNWFFAGDTRADVAGPGQSTTPDGQFTADDIIVFLNRFFAGC
jgi:hypothetical protein